MHIDLRRTISKLYASYGRRARHHARSVPKRRISRKRFWWVVRAYRNTSRTNVKWSRERKKKENAIEMKINLIERKHTNVRLWHSFSYSRAFLFPILSICLIICRLFFMGESTFFLLFCRIRMNSRRLTVFITFKLYEFWCQKPNQKKRTFGLAIKTRCSTRDEIIFGKMKKIVNRFSLSYIVSFTVWIHVMLLKRWKKRQKTCHLSANIMRTKYVYLNEYGSKICRMRNIPFLSKIKFKVIAYDNVTLITMLKTTSGCFIRDEFPIPTGIITSLFSALSQLNYHQPLIFSS